MKIRRLFAKVALWLTALCVLIASGCSFVGLQTPWDKQTHIFQVQYDYGFHKDGKISPLLDGCSVFFDLEKYEIWYLAAGDEVYVEYTGEMIMAESYPGQIFIRNGNLISVSVRRALADTLVCGELTGEGEEQTRTLLSETLAVEETNLPQYVITQKDGTFMKLTEMSEGQTLYATYRSSGGVNTICGLYMFDPTMVKDVK